MTLKRFTLKLQAYASYFNTKRHTEKFNIRFFRVLTVTSTAARCKNLVSAAVTQKDVRDLARMFLFTEGSQLPLARPETVFEKIWTVPACKEPQSLLWQVLPENPNRRESISPMQNNPNANTEVHHGP